MRRRDTFNLQPSAATMARLMPAVACLVLAALLPRPARAERWSFQQVLEAFERHGFTVLSDHPRCAERGLYGLYLRESRRIVVCPRGNRVETLLHEGWHAVQSRCLGGVPLLDDDTLRRELSRQDRRDLARLYAVGAWRREAEARVMARRDPAAYVRLVDELCPLPVIPPAAAPPQRVPQGQAVKRTGS